AVALGYRIMPRVCGALECPRGRGPWSRTGPRPVMSVPISQGSTLGYHPTPRVCGASACHRSIERGPKAPPTRGALCF
ncbi:MAG: hypothetical protein ACP5LD_15050, partial [Desulfomonilaceae bacterium]